MSLSTLRGTSPSRRTINKNALTNAESGGRFDVDARRIATYRRFCASSAREVLTDTLRSLVQYLLHRLANLRALQPAADGHVGGLPDLEADQQRAIRIADRDEETSRFRIRSDAMAVA